MCSQKDEERHKAVPAELVEMVVP
jgi:hypothetical protein